MIHRRTFMASCLGASCLGAALAGAPARAASGVLEISQAQRLAIYLPLYVAADAGLFARHGLDARISTAGGIALPIPMLSHDMAQIGVTSPGMAVNATVDGMRLKAIAKIAGGASLWAVARPDSTVRSLADLKGKKIATLRFPSSTIQVPIYAMKTLGRFDPREAGVTFLELPPGTLAAAVDAGRADLAVAFEWERSEGTERFGLKPVLSFAEMLGPLCFSTAIAQERFIDREPGVVQAFCDALAEAQKLLHTDQDVLARVARAYFSDVAPAVLASGARNFLSSPFTMPRNPTTSPEEWERAMRLEAVGGAVPRTLPYETMVDNSFALAATHAYGLPT